MKIINQCIKFLLLALLSLIFVACSGGNCATNSNNINPPIITPLPNSGGAVAEIAVSSLSIPSGSNTTSTAVHLQGGAAGLMIGLSSTVTVEPASNKVQSNQIINAIPITVSFNPESLFAGSIINSSVLVQITAQLNPGTYYINIYANYQPQGQLLLGTIKITIGSINPTPTANPTDAPNPTPTVSPTNTPSPAPSPTETPIPVVVPGTLSLLPSEGISINVDDNESITLALNNSTNVTNLVVSLNLSNQGIATKSLATCTLSTIVNTCTIEISGISSGNSQLTATATNYQAVDSNITVNYPYYYPTSVAFNPNGSIAYIANAGAGVIAMCNVESNGSFINCKNSGFTDSLDYISSITVTPNGNNIIVALNVPDGPSDSPGIWSCAINQDGSINNLANCSMINSEDNTTSIVWNLDKSQLFITSGNNIIYSCPFNSGNLGSCITAYNDLTYLNSPATIAFSTSTQAFIPNISFWNNNKIIVSCAVNGSSVTSCDQNTVYPTIQHVMYMVVDNSGNYGFILTNYGQDLYECNINESALDNCADTNVTSINANSMTFNNTGDLLYIANTNNNKITYCTASNGNLSSCSNTN